MVKSVLATDHSLAQISLNRGFYCYGTITKWNVGRKEFIIAYSSKLKFIMGFRTEPRDRN